MGRGAVAEFAPSPAPSAAPCPLPSPAPSPPLPSLPPGCQAGRLSEAESAVVRGSQALLEVAVRTLTLAAKPLVEGKGGGEMGRGGWSLEGKGGEGGEGRKGG